ncbi:MAG: lipid A biosynthesis lauroyl acyltransferase [Rickettsiales bacterium]
MIRKAKHYIEAGVLYLLFNAFRQFPLNIVSFFGGWMARAIGPYLKAHKIAHKNLSQAFPNLSKKEQYKLLNKMWDNLGRVSAELAHLSKSNSANELILKRIKITGAENLPIHGKPAFMFSGHVGNWELLAPVAKAHNRPITAVYREANNKIVDNMIAKIRAKHCFNLIPKGQQGSVKIVRAIKNNEAIAMLVDQKMNDGISVPFFGRPAMTAPAIAQLALRYDAPIIPARVIRTTGKKGWGKKGWGAHFEAIIYPPLEYKKTGNMEKDVQNIMLAINQILEGWIREYPEQWFWVHKRWPKA